MKKMLGCSVALAAALSVCSADTPLRSVDQLPVDRFDQYQPNTFPPYPWLKTGTTGKDVDILLKKEANSPFVKNEVTGKALVLTDSSKTSGQGVGVKIDFRPPPEGKVYLGFDFKFTNPKTGAGVDLICKLDNKKSGRGLMLNLGKDGKLTIEDLQGGTFTISNGGVYGSMLSTPILNLPQSGVLGMHNIVERAIVIDGEIKIRPVMYLALSYDHRIIDGKESVSFLKMIKENLEDPRRLFLDI